MNYRNMIIKYMALVCAAEGIDFLPNEQHCPPGTYGYDDGHIDTPYDFTREEMDEMLRLRHEELT